MVVLDVSICGIASGVKIKVVEKVGCASFEILDQLVVRRRIALRID